MVVGVSERRLHLGRLRPVGFISIAEKPARLLLNTQCHFLLALDSSNLPISSGPDLCRESCTKDRPDQTFVYLSQVLIHSLEAY